MHTFGPNILYGCHQRFFVITDTLCRMGNADFGHRRRPFLGVLFQISYRIDIFVMPSELLPVNMMTQTIRVR